MDSTDSSVGNRRFNKYSKCLHIFKFICVFVKFNLKKADHDTT